MNIEISVIVPTYKRPALLMNCIKHLEAQNFFKAQYEVIVVTDGPDINTKNEIEKFAQQHLSFNIYCYNLNEKKGPAAARNKGVQYAKGSLIVFTDDDCLPQAEWLTEYWNAYTSNKENNVAFTGRTIVPNSKTPTDYDRNVANLQTAEFITANCAITKQAFNKVAGFDEEFPIAWREDSDMHFKLIEASVPIHHVDKATLIHPVRKAGWGVSLKEQKKSVFNALLYKKHPELYRQKISAKALWNYYAMIYLFIFFTICMLRGFDFLAFLFFITWLLLLVEFIVRRLRNTSKKLSHVIEMIVTSAIIPFLSVFWTIYGSLKYKTFLL